MKKIEFTYKVYDNKIEITPVDGVKDNAIYEIVIKGLKSEDRSKVADEMKMQVTTRLNPAYSTLEAVRSLTDSYEIPDDRILFFIREASLFAEYIRQEEFSDEAIPFEVKQYVKYKAAYDSLLKFYMDTVTGSSLKGTLGEITFENKVANAAIKDLLKAVKEEVEKWKEHLRGYGLEGRAAPQSAVKGSMYRPVRPVPPAFGVKFNGGSFTRGGRR